MSQPPAHSVGTLYEIRWREICPWLILVRALRVTLLVRVLLLALVGLILTQWGWVSIDLIVSIDEGPLIGMSDQQRTLSKNSLTLIEVIESHKIDRSLQLSTRSIGTFYLGWYWLTEPFLRMVGHAPTWRGSLGLFVCGLWSIAVWALLGGAIARIAAVYLTRGEVIGPLVALRAAVSKWPSTVGAPLIVLLSALAMAVPLFLLGLLLHVGPLATVVGLIWVVVLAWGFMLAFVLVGIGLGWPLMWSCLGVERSDAFDGVSRCYAYVYQRPLHLAFYVLVASLLCFLGDTVVALFTSATVTLAQWVLSFAMSGDQAAEVFTAEWNADAPLAKRAIDSWTWAFTLILKAYPLASLWSMAVGIYLLLRRHVDATEMEEIALENHEAHSLSALKAKEPTDTPPSARED